MRVGVPIKSWLVTVVVAIGLWVTNPAVAGTRVYKHLQYIVSSKKHQWNTAFPVRERSERMSKEWKLPLPFRHHLVISAFLMISALKDPASHCDTVLGDIRLMMFDEDALADLLFMIKRTIAQY